LGSSEENRGGGKTLKQPEGGRPKVDLLPLQMKIFRKGGRLIRGRINHPSSQYTLRKKSFPFLDSEKSSYPEKSGFGGEGEEGFTNFLGLYRGGTFITL